MNQELLHLLEQISREKGIDKSLLIDAVLSAILSAARKSFGPIENLDARLDERARRRYEELKLKDPAATMESTIEDIKKRDTRDASRETSPLQRTDDMIYIDSTGLSIEEVVEEVIKHLRINN